MIQLAVVDVDGCLTPGEAAEWNWDALQIIGRFNRNNHRDGSQMAVTLCTGRQEPYVEVLMQAIGARQPGIYENGCGLYFPDRYRFEVNPLITPAILKTLAEVKKILESRIIQRELAYFQPGKETSITLYPLGEMSVARLHRFVGEVIEPFQSVLAIQTSVTSLDVTPAGIDKGTGLRWLSERTGIRLEEMGGIGDSPGDLPFLSLVGRSAAPANAAETVKAVVGYVSDKENGDGVVDILNHWAAMA